MANLLVINPNSNERVTQGIDDSLAHFREAGIAIYCSTLEKAPFGIESDEDGLGGTEWLVKARLFDTFLGVWEGDPVVVSTPGV